jgi:activator of HSP90 ATPase
VADDSKPAGVVGGVAKINMSLEFVCSASDLYKTLTDQTRVRMWTRGPANFEAFVSGNFSLFDGNISGSIVELVREKMSAIILL